MNDGAKVAITFALVTLLGVAGCKNDTHLSDLVDSYIVVNFRASDQWKKAHSAYLEWQGQKLAFPVLFKLADRADGGMYYDGPAPKLVLNPSVGEIRQVTTAAFVQTEPQCKLETTFQVEQLLPPGGQATTLPDGRISYSVPNGKKTSYVKAYSFWPDGEHQWDHQLLTNQELEKILTGPVILVGKDQ